MQKEERDEYLMDKEKILENLEEVAKKLSIEVRYEDLETKGGMCRLKDRQIIMVNKSLPLKEKIKTLAQNLRRLDLNKVYILPALREVIKMSQ